MDDYRLPFVIKKPNTPCASVAFLIAPTSEVSFIETLVYESPLSLPFGGNVGTSSSSKKVRVRRFCGLISG